jgi:fatty acid-binding protein DegV
MAETILKPVRKAIGEKRVKAAIGHADNLKAAEKLKGLIENNLDAEVVLVSGVSAAIGNHSGPGTLIVSFYEIDK